MTRPTKKEELLSTSALAERTGLNRATVREKLKAKGVRPREEGPRKALYDAAEALAALEAEERGGLREAQTKKTEAEAERAKLKLAKEKGDVVNVRAVREDLREIFTRLHQHFVINYPRTAAARLARKKPSQIEAGLRQDAEQFFNELRAEHKSYL